VQVCERTAADKKGGHLALRKSDGKFMLRESAMCPDAGTINQSNYLHVFLANGGLLILLTQPTTAAAAAAVHTLADALVQLFTPRARASLNAEY
jgi:hypothetical protein